MKRSVYKNLYGFGYEVAQITDDHKRIVEYHTPLKEQAQQAKENLDAGLPTHDPYNIWPFRILKFNEKHGDNYFIVRTIEEFQDVCLKVFNQRNSEGYYDWIKDIKEPESLDFDKDSINSLPESLKEEASRKYLNYSHQLNQYRIGQKNLQICSSALNGNKESAMHWLLKQRNAEYENFELIDPTNY